MTDVQAVWISTITFCVLTTVGFIILAEWSAGGAAPWSIAAGVARGIRDWADDHPEVVGIVSTPATEPQPPIDTAALPLPPLTDPAHEAIVEDLAEVEFEELTSRRT